MPGEEIANIIDNMVIFDNANVIVLNKLGGFSVQGGNVAEKNIFSLLATRYKK
jgi:hypothetical protein